MGNSAYICLSFANTADVPSMRSRFITILLTFLLHLVVPVSGLATTPPDSWQELTDKGEYSSAVDLAVVQGDNPLAELVAEARLLDLSATSMWRSLMHYKPTLTGKYRSQIDAEHFFLGDAGATNPQAELDATLAAFFATVAKAPLRLTPTCRFVARKYWLLEVLPTAAQLLPQPECEEFTRYVSYLDAHTLTLIFPAAHPNSPSSAFGHTLIRVDKKDQSPDARLLNMSLNFAADVPEEVSSMSYAVRGLGGGFQGKYRLLPYHIKLREYAQIENRDTWEYQLKLSQDQVDLVVRHSYEMLIAHYDYFFLSENCSYHLLTLLDVAFADEPLSEAFNLWTIPVDTIKELRNRGLVAQSSFIPSAIRTLRARRDKLSDEEREIALKGFYESLAAIESDLQALPAARQALTLDLLADYNRYERLKNDSTAGAMSPKEREVLSRRARLSLSSGKPEVTPTDSAPELGHETTRLSVRYLNREVGGDHIELGFRPAYHDFRDPSVAYGSTAAIDFFNVTLAHNVKTDRSFLREIRILGIESIEPRGEFFKPVSWHTRLNWARPDAGSRHQFSFNVGAGGAWKLGDSAGAPVLFGFLESDFVDAPQFDTRTFLQAGASGGMHWEPKAGWRMGLELETRYQLGHNWHGSTAEVWGSVAVHRNLSFVFDASVTSTTGNSSQKNSSAQIRYYF